MCGGGGVAVKCRNETCYQGCLDLHALPKHKISRQTTACDDVTADSCTDVTRTFVGHAAGVEIVLGGGAQRLQVLGLERHDAQEVVAVLQRHASSRHIEHSQGTFW